jgi:GST-like protein
MCIAALALCMGRPFDSGRRAARSGSSNTGRAMKDFPDLHAFPITRRWPPRDNGVIQLYSYPTPNGAKVSIALEELGLPYEAHKVTLADADVKSPEFTSLNPNGKIPALIDPNGPEGRPIGLFESGAILLYLSEKTGKLAGTTAAERWDVTQWLMFQMGGVGPMFGQLGFFVKFGGKDVADPIPRERYVGEARRLLGVLDRHLEGRDWIAGDYSIADIAIAPWLRGLDFYGARDLVGWSGFANVTAYLDRFLARPAVQRGLDIPPRD